MPAGYDAEVAELFRDLRAASNLSEADLAARIATPVEVVQALEQGAIYALPPWPETARVVNAYGSLLNLDTRPLLRRIYAQIESGVVELGPKPVPEVPVMPPQAGGGDAALGGGPAPEPAPAPPQPQPQPQPPQQSAPGQPAWQNGPAAPQPQAPVAPNWPGGAQPFPQGGVPGAPGQPQAPQAPQWPQQAPQHGGAPQPPYQPPPGYPPHAAPPHPPEDASFLGDEAGMGADATIGDATMGDASMGVDAAMHDPAAGGDMAMGAPAAGDTEPQSKRQRPALLKWGIAALIAAVILIGLWMILGDSSDRSSSSGSFTSDPVLDPDDPRSRKGDRLPNNF